MTTLEQLKSGKLNGAKQLKLSCGLYDFPMEILDLADTLEVLDLTGNSLNQLPDDFGKLKKLKIAFFSNNQFTQLPEVLSQCTTLDIIGFKANQISYVPESALPLNIRWLILTDNKIKNIPKSIGRCSKLQKVMLAGNNLRSLPIEMSLCQNIELLRISANALEEIPLFIYSLPKLSWFAFGGNPCSSKSFSIQHLKTVDWKEFIIEEQLGEGASGVIFKATWEKQGGKQIALKIFKGNMTSDGLPLDEMNACIASGNHKNLVPILGVIVNHPDDKQGLVLELIPPAYKNLGGPPSFVTCTRDVFSDKLKFNINNAISILSGIASAVAQLHSKGIMHGDLYAHNILFNEDFHAILGDFGAATFYDTKDHPNAEIIERLEVRAFGCLMEDLIDRIELIEAKDEQLIKLNKLKQDCLTGEIFHRPSFIKINSNIQEVLEL